MPLSPPDPWVDGQAGGTPTSADRFNSRETMLAAYTDQQSAQTAVFAKAGVLAQEVGAGGFVFPLASTVVSCRARVGTAPVGANIICDVNKNAATIFSTQGNRPTITAGQTLSPVAVPNTTAFAAGDVMTVDIDQVGSGTPGSDLTVIVLFRLV